MMGRLAHFEIHAEDMGRAKQFYEKVFDWDFKDFSSYVGKPYFIITTGTDNEVGIDGGLMLRIGNTPEADQAINGFVCTIVVEDYDAIEAKILSNGGKLLTPKSALPGMAWQGYYYDTEGNILGIHQPDQYAK